MKRLSRLSRFFTRALVLVPLMSAMIGASIQALACEPEAQVIGEVTHVVSSPDHCRVFAEFSWYQASQVCPLDRDYVRYEGIYFSQENCFWRPGDVITGVLVRVGPDVILD